MGSTGWSNAYDDSRWRGRIDVYWRTLPIELFIVFSSLTSVLKELIFFLPTMMGRRLYVSTVGSQTM